MPPAASPEILFWCHDMWPVFRNMEVAEGHGSFTTVNILHPRVDHCTLVLPPVGGVPPRPTYTDATTSLFTLNKHFFEGFRGCHNM